MCCFYPLPPSRYVKLCSCKWEQNYKALTLCVTEMDEQEVNLLGHGVQGSQGDLMVLGSNQKVRLPIGRADASWAVKPSPLYFCPHLPCSQDTKSRKSQVISSLGTNSALGHHLHMTLIPHLSGCKTCRAFDGKHLNLFGSPKTTALAIWTNHSGATSKLWPDHSPPSQNESLSSGRRAHFIKISFGLMMMSRLNEQEMIIHSNLEMAWTFMLTCKYIHKHTHTHAQKEETALDCSKTEKVAGILYPVRQPSLICTTEATILNLALISFDLCGSGGVRSVEAVSPAFRSSSLFMVTDACIVPKHAS